MSVGDILDPSNSPFVNREVYRYPSDAELLCVRAPKWLANVGITEGLAMLTRLGWAGLILVLGEDAD